MTLAEMAGHLALEDLTPALRDVKDLQAAAGYASDLLSDVLSSAPGRSVLVTIQAHMNAVAVAVHAGLVAVVFASSKRPGDDVVRRSVEKGVQLYLSRESTFTVAGRLYELGLRGRVA